MMAVTKGPNAFIIARPINDGNHELAPKSSSEGRDCFVKTTPIIKPVSVISVTDLKPISKHWLITSET
jgi:hypothetical protein